jgi:hypothetical protein
MAMWSQITGVRKLSSAEGSWHASLTEGAEEQENAAVPQRLAQDGAGARPPRSGGSAP